MAIKPSNKVAYAKKVSALLKKQNPAKKAAPRKNPAPKARKYYVVDQEQNGLWYQVAFFLSKVAAFEYAKAAHAAKGGRWRVQYTYPSGHHYPVK